MSGKTKPPTFSETTQKLTGYLLEQEHDAISPQLLCAIDITASCLVLMKRVAKHIVTNLTKSGNAPQSKVEICFSDHFLLSQNDDMMRKHVLID